MLRVVALIRVAFLYLQGGIIQQWLHILYRELLVSGCVCFTDWMQYAVVATTAILGVYPVCDNHASAKHKHLKQLIQKWLH